MSIADRGSKYEASGFTRWCSSSSSLLSQVLSISLALPSFSFITTWAKEAKHSSRCAWSASWSACRFSSWDFKRSQTSVHADVKDVGGYVQVGGGSGGSAWSSFSSLLSLLGDTVRVARWDCSLLLRTSGVEEAAGTAAEEGEAGGTPAKAAWWRTARRRSRSLLAGPHHKLSKCLILINLSCRAAAAATV